MFPFLQDVLVSTFPSFSFLLEMDSTLLPAYTAILVMALVPIWYGSHCSLDHQLVETMSSQDAWMFPIIGSGVLFGLYILLNVLELKEYVNLLLTGYFLFFGIVAVATTLQPFIKYILPFLSDGKATKFSLSIPFKAEPLKVKWRASDLVSVLVGTLVGVWYMSSKHWVANNLLGLAFSVQGVAFISLGSFKVGCILLGGLFLYDIFWVFGTNVMVSVAKSFDAPVKLLFPKDLFASPPEFSMLGLGDIVIPGIFVALMLRLDYLRAGKIKPFEKPYFSFAFVAYLLGMVTTIGVMHVFRAPQPALLYLVPFCIGGSLLCALLLGEVSLLLFFDAGSMEKNVKNQNKHQSSKRKRSRAK